MFVYNNKKINENKHTSSIINCNHGAHDFHHLPDHKLRPAKRAVLDDEATWPVGKNSALVAQSAS